MYTQRTVVLTGDQMIAITTTSGFISTYFVRPTGINTSASYVEFYEARSN